MDLQTKPEISWDDFAKLDIRTGTVVAVRDFPAARNPSFQLDIDFGVMGIRKSSAQITERYRKEDLLGLQIIAIVNFPPKQIANFMSECLVLGIYTENKEVVLLTPESGISNGLAIG